MGIGNWHTTAMQRETAYASLRVWKAETGYWSAEVVRVSDGVSLNAKAGFKTQSAAMNWADTAAGTNGETMTTYQIEQIATAVILWTGEALTEQAALDAYAQAAGYASHSAMAAEHSDDGVRVRAVSAVETVKRELERIGVADTGLGGVVAQAVEDEPGQVEIADEAVSARYEVAKLLPLLDALPTNLEATFEDDATPDGETAARKAYEHFWQATASAEAQ